LPGMPESVRRRRGFFRPPAEPGALRRSDVT
jgi:hypothetical protein